MSEAYIEEYSADLAPRVLATWPARITPDVVQAEVTFAASAQSAALNARTVLALVTVDGDACYLEAANPTADTNDRYLPADTPTPIFVTGGNKIAFIDAD